MRRLDFISKHIMGRVLDIGCKEKPEIHEYLAKFVNNIYGLDICPAKMEKFVVGDCHYLPYRSNCFDSVVMGELIEHLPNPIEALMEVHRVLSFGGRLIVTTPNSYSWLRMASYVLKNREQEQHPDHLWLFTPAMLKRMIINCGFKVNALEVLKPKHRLGSYIAICAEKIE